MATQLLLRQRTQPYGGRGVYIYIYIYIYICVCVCIYIYIYIYLRPHGVELSSEGSKGFACTKQGSLNELSVAVKQIYVNKNKVIHTRSKFISLRWFPRCCAVESSVDGDSARFRSQIRASCVPNHRLYRCITTLQCGETRRMLEAGIETRSTLR